MTVHDHHLPPIPSIRSATVICYVVHRYATTLRLTQTSGGGGGSEKKNASYKKSAIKQKCVLCYSIVEFFERLLIDRGVHRRLYLAGDKKRYTVIGEGRGGGGGLIEVYVRVRGLLAVFYLVVSYGNCYWGSGQRGGTSYLGLEGGGS